MTVTVGTAELAVANPLSLTGPPSIPRNWYGDYILEATFENGTGAGPHPVTGLAEWTSSNTTAATFSAPGHLVSANVVGSTYVSATYAGVTSPLLLVNITDSKIPTAITISAAPNRTTAVPAGADAEYPTRSNGFTPGLKLYATVDYADGTSEVDPTGVVWAAVAPIANAVVFETGGVLRTGDVAADTLQTVSATYVLGGVQVTDTFIVRLKDGAIAALTIVNADGTAATNSVADGLTQEYGVLATFAGAQYWYTRNAVWTSASPTVGTIAVADDTATFTAVAPGTTQVAATRSTIIGTLNVTVTTAVPQYLFCEPLTLSLGVNNKAQLRAYVHNSDGTENDITTNVATSWTSTDVAVATFLGSDPKGLITALAPGSVYAYPSYQSLPIDDADRCVITVPDPNP
jgi:hypothetical protein